MTTRVLAVIAEGITTSACLDAAEAAAHALGDSTIEALHVVVDPHSLIAASEEISFQELREHYEGTSKQRAADTRRAFEQWLSFHPNVEIPLNWKELVGGEEETLTKEAASFDILVLARATNLDGADALHAAIFAIGLPFILVPSNWRLRTGSAFAERVVVAWNSTRACRKAVDGALPWLRLAKEVIVLLVEGSETSAEPLAEKLQNNKVQFQIQHVKRDQSLPLGDQLLHEAHTYGADLLVMGVYRHNQFIEWLVGDTTRQVLAHLDLPLLGSH
jgi:nucleotide-binding universal stress UspA family protein